MFGAKIGVNLSGFMPPSCAWHELRARTILKNNAMASYCPLGMRCMPKPICNSLICFSLYLAGCLTSSKRLGDFWRTLNAYD